MSSPDSADVRGRDDDFVTGEADLETLRSTITAFIREYVDRADAEGVVVNMSGGIDSTVAATLAVDALGSDRVDGLILPCNLSTEATTRDAESIAESLGVEAERIQIQPLLNQFVDRVTPAIDHRNERIALGNVTARLRMTCAYYAANVRDKLVLGTSNRSELLLGYFTKHGDGGADLLPIGDLYKTEVRALAAHLDVPDHVIEKPPTAGLWVGQTDEAELGASYEGIDAILYRLVEVGETPERVASELELEAETVRTFARTRERNHHKRTMPPTPAGATTGAEDESLSELLSRTGPTGHSDF